MLLFELILLFRDENIGVKLVPFSVSELLDGVSHGFDKEFVKLRIKVILVVLCQTTNRLVVTLEMFSDNSNDRFFHFLFEDVIFTLGINFIEEFLLHVVELSLGFSLSLVLCICFKQLFSEHGVELLGEGLYG
jgi:hypothetical protein